MCSEVLVAACGARVLADVSADELRAVEAMIVANVATFLEAWYEFFPA